MNTNGRTRQAARHAGGGVIGLGLALVAVSGGDIIAQNDQATRRPAGRYTVVGGDTNGSHSNAIYILDSANRELIALRWNDSRGELEGIGFRDLVKDLSMDAER